MKDIILRWIGEDKEEMSEAYDNDSHRYQIPVSKTYEWSQFLDIPADDESSWDVPEWAERVDGMPIIQSQGYNQAKDELHSRMGELVEMVCEEIIKQKNSVVHTHMGGYDCSKDILIDDIINKLKQ